MIIIIIIKRPSTSSTANMELPSGPLFTDLMDTLMIITQNSVNYGPSADLQITAILSPQADRICLPSTQLALCPSAIKNVWNSHRRALLSDAASFVRRF